jgi:hypothetical protein
VRTQDEIHFSMRGARDLFQRSFSCFASEDPKQLRPPNRPYVQLTMSGVRRRLVTAL